ncbi:hypothetical protein [Gordonia shandongensis]|uniref:hypothetical protein n=1 Tax=Gordonia shandongensis TaxID=376351 RepID=UPI0006846B32|nr:hypothetical protein [Gordonia shandongensis]
MRTRRSAVAVGIATLAVTAGCSAERGTAHEAAAPGAADPARVQSLVLSADDFPADYDVTEMSDDERKAIVDGLRAGTTTTTISPASCMQVRALPEDDVTDIGMRMATKRRASISETVTVADLDLDALRKRVDGECATMTVRITEGAAAGSTGTTVSSVIDSPVTRGRDALVVRQDSEISTPGPAVTTTTVVGYAPVNGYAVIVQALNTAGDEPDRDTFDELFAEAIEKVEEQTA